MDPVKLDHLKKHGKILAVSLSSTHTLRKLNQPVIRLLEGLGVDGDAHKGVTVKHRSRVAKDPTQPNLRQVHLIHDELLQELHQKGMSIAPGEMGENITTTGIALLDLPPGTQLRIGDEAVVEVTGLRNPCYQLNSIYPRLMQAVLDRDEEGILIRKAGIMGIVLKGGDVSPQDTISVVLPQPPYRKLEKV